MKKLYVLIVVMAVLLMSFTFFNIGSNSQPMSHAVAVNSSIESKIMTEIKDRGIDSKYVIMPDLTMPPRFSDGVITPSYKSAPAPMGIGFYGTKVVGGKLIGYNLTTSSVSARITMNGMDSFYLLNDGPYSVTFQLNSVLKNVTLFGNYNYSFWTQNVVFYSSRTHQLTFLDNIWNFSSPAFYMSPNALYSYDGKLMSPVYYYDIGPTINVTYPFTLQLYLNSSIVDGRTAVFFNYSIMTSDSYYSGSYDQVLFNSTVGTLHATAVPKYLASGTTLTPDGYTPYDFEIMVGGPGGGSTTSVYGINATMNLMYLDNGTYMNVPSAYDVGSETGETSEGVAVAWHGTTAYLTPGPSFVYGMWNISSSDAMETYSGSVSPSNAFMFVSGAPFSVANASWVPLSSNGSFKFTIPAGNYQADVMMSYYSPETASLSSSTHIVLFRDADLGIYTPLYAMDNQQLANISISGNGSQSSPYVIDNYQPSYIAPIFGEFNDYAFPVFYGLLIMGTSAHVVISNMPSLSIAYTDPSYEGVISFFNLPAVNDLNYEFYDVSNISMWHDYAISGWFSFEQAGFPVANVVIWNSTAFLVGSSAFNIMDSGLLIYGSPDVVVWGNYFLESQSSFNYSMYGPINVWGEPLGLAEYSSGDVIYNNYFAVQANAYSPDVSIYSGQPTIYMNEWNITEQPASNVHMFNGFKLTGSIIGTSYQGGNFWWNFDGVVPYNDDGLIYYGGDYDPLHF